MGSIIEIFHVDIKLLAAQIFNFAIVFAVLYFFALKPLVKVMQDRTKKIEKGISDADLAKEKIEEITKKEKEVLVEARKESQKIIMAAEETATKNKEETIKEAKNQAEKVLSDAKKQIEEEKIKIVEEAKSEVAKLVMLGVGKIVDEKMNEERDEKIVSNIVGDKKI